MNSKRKLLSAMVVSLLAVWLMVGPAFSQAPGKGEGVTGARTEAPKTTLTGKIVNMKSLGGYAVITEKPHEEYKVINVNEEVLGPLAKSGKHVTIAGSLPRGAFFLFIEKIDGKPYQGPK